MDSLDDCADRHSAPGMCLRIEEHFGMPDVLLLRPRQIRPREIVEIPIPKEHPAALVINVEKGLEVRKLIRFLHFLRRFEWKVDAVPGGKLKHQFRLECALNVKVQLGFRHAFDQIPHRLSTPKGYSR